MKRSLRYLFMIFLFICSFVVQGSILPYFSLGDTAPNLMLILTVSAGILEGPYTGMGMGLFAGLLSDLYFSEYIGFYALIYLLIGYLTGVIGTYLFVDDYKYTVPAVAAADLLYGLYCFTFQFLFRSRLYGGYFFLHYVFPEMLYTALLSIPLFPLIIRLRKWEEAGQRKGSSREGTHV